MKNGGFKNRHQQNFINLQPVTDNQPFCLPNYCPQQQPTKFISGSITQSKLHNMGEDTCSALIRCESAGKQTALLRSNAKALKLNMCALNQCKLPGNFIVNFQRNRIQPVKILNFILQFLTADRQCLNFLPKLD